MSQAIYVSAHQPPPDAVAYVEDNRDRLWTGKGLGLWRCLTHPSGGPVFAPWNHLWTEHGPLVPLVPAEVLAEPVGEEFSESPHRAGRGLPAEPHPMH